MIGLISSAVGTAAQIAAAVIPNNQIIEESTVYTPDPMSVRNAGLYNTAVDLNPEKQIKSTDANASIKAGLSVLGTAAPIAGGLIGGGDRVKRDRTGKKPITEITAQSSSDITYPDQNLNDISQFSKLLKR